MCGFRFFRNGFNQETSHQHQTVDNDHIARAPTRVHHFISICFPATPQKLKSEPKKKKKTVTAREIVGSRWLSYCSRRLSEAGCSHAWSVGYREISPRTELGRPDLTDLTTGLVMAVAWSVSARERGAARVFFLLKRRRGSKREDKIET